MPKKNNEVALPIEKEDELISQMTRGEFKELVSKSVADGLKAPSGGWAMASMGLKWVLRLSGGATFGMSAFELVRCVVGK